MPFNISHGFCLIEIFNKSNLFFSTKVKIKYKEQNYFKIRKPNNHKELSYLFIFNN